MWILMPSELNAFREFFIIFGKSVEIDMLTIEDIMEVCLSQYDPGCSVV